MQDQQRIDILNNIINERESAVWLRDALKDVLKYRDELGHKEENLKALDEQCATRQKELAGLDEQYVDKQCALEQELDATRTEYGAAVDKLAADYERDRADIATALTANREQLADAQAALANVHQMIAEAKTKQAQADAALAKARKDYEDYKAGLK